MKTYIEFVAYFEGMPTDIPGLASAAVGGDEGLIDEQSQSLQYPHLRVETPQINYIGGGEADAQTRYRTRIFVITGKTSPTWQQENTALSEMEGLLRAVYNKVWDDAEGVNAFDLSPNAEGDAVRAWSSDNCFGWYINIVIDLNTSNC